MDPKESMKRQNVMLPFPRTSYWIDKKGPATISSLRPGTEHAVEIIILRSPAWMQDRVSKSLVLGTVRSNRLETPIITSLETEKVEQWSTHVKDMSGVLNWGAG